MSRSIWKGPFVDPKLLALSVDFRDKSLMKPIKTESRSTTILPTFVGQKFAIHNGKSWQSTMIHEDMIGHKLGEFSRTRKTPKHKVKTPKVSSKK